jgi:succinate dehydrogenase/fumarate reductase flavoprotein subunit
MFGYVEAQSAYWHAHGMARSCGVKLAGAVVEGIITRRELAEIVGRCQNCTCVADCETWLSELHPEASPPSFCAIAPPLRDMAPGR